jgi:hypothetical protein
MVHIWDHRWPVTDSIEFNVRTSSTDFIAKSFEESAEGFPGVK